MAESTLAYEFNRLRREIGREIGYNHGDYSLWTGANAYKAVDVNDCISAGLIRFYRARDWEFLKPVIEIPLYANYETGTIAIVSGVVTLTGGTFPTWAASGDLVVEEVYSVSTRDSGTQLTLTDTTVNVAALTEYSLRQTSYELPDDFGGFVSRFLSYRPNTEAGPIRVCLIHPDQITELRRVYDYSTFVLRAAVVVRGRVAATTGTRYDLLLWPGSVGAGRLLGRARVHPDMLTGTDPLKYPYGGVLHGPTIDAICKHEACRRFKKGYDGSYFEEYRKVLLPESITRDAEAFSPQTLGFDYGTGPSYDEDTIAAMTLPYGAPSDPFPNDP